MGSDIYFGMNLPGGFDLTNITVFAGIQYTQGNILAHIDMLHLGTNHPS